MAEINSNTTTTHAKFEKAHSENPSATSVNGTNGDTDVTHLHHHEHNHEGDPNGGALFQINVKLPHDPYKMFLTVTSQEQVQDVRQSIVESPGTFQYTCFHLEHNGERINDFIELADVKDLKAGSELVLVEDPYTEREARMHVVRIRELIGAAGDRVDQLHGICAGISLHDTVVAPRNALINDSSAPAHPLVGFEIDAPCSIQTVVPQQQETLPRTLKSISISPWNPPPYHLRQRGHLLYLQVTTNEGEQYQITSTVSGFFVSRSSSNKFDPFPRPAPKNHSAHSLLSLIALISPSFNKAFTELQEANNKKDLLTTFPFQNAIPANPWLVPSSSSPLTQHQPDQTRAQEAYLIGGVDSTETLRDWNEEFQSTRELPRENVQDRVFRERLTSKLFADYNDAAARGAVLVARGEVAPLNPTEGKDAQIFVYNNIFFSFGADGVQTFASEGGDEAARVAVGKDVMGVRAVNQLDIPDLYTPGTVVVDYLGKRIVGQSIVPGIFKQREPGEPQIDYGGVEGREIVTENEAFVSVFERLSKAIHVKKHAVWDKECERHDLEGSIETKGLLGTDGRKYALDMYRITPLDVAWADEVASSDGSGFGKYPHRMAILRLELVEAYRRMKLQEYVKAEVERRKAEPKAQVDEKGEQKGLEQSSVNDLPPQVAEGSVEKTVQTSQEEGGEGQELVDLSNFKFALNPDVCSGQVPQTDEEKREYAQDEEEVRAVCAYLRTKAIPDLIQDLYDNDVGYPMDGQSLSQLLHKRGINVRYLGKVATLAAEKGNRLRALVGLAHQEMVARAFKHITNRCLRHLPSVFAVSCVSHLLNCLLGFQVNENPRPDIDEELKEMYPEGDFSFEKTTPQDLRADIEKQISIRYRYCLPPKWLADLKPLQTLREISLKQGLQLAAKDYIFRKNESKSDDGAAMTNGVNHVNGHNSEEQRKKKKKGGDHALSNGTSPKPTNTFTPDDILNITPVVKDAAPRSALAEEALEAGRISLQQNHKQLGQELILESLSLHEQIYGILHPEVAKMYHQLSMIYFQTNEKDAAVELARKAVIVTERTLGLDSADTILAYLNLSLFEHSMGNTKIALNYVKHALDLWKIIYGPNHPDSITTMNNAAVMLQTLKQYSDSRRWFEASLAVCEDLFGRQSINSATILFQLAQALALDQDSKGAVNRMREAYNIFHSELGPNDRNTKEAESWLEQLTQNAVSIAKHAKDIQNRRLRRFQLTSDVSFGTRPLPQVGRAGAETASNSARSNTRPMGLDSRSIDELLKFIEGADGGSSPQAKQKKRAKAMNPKLRSRAKEAVAA
ncbi:Intracellular distribution of mitochondria [Endocarpon pusillum]|uniref:Clustered mitochondria protein homolog n=1 Tax=Endocarpon pusillum TaxID=364733 RepID=A0A8H7AK25_9EURO|nr:Intracellular distribution of mitochondria [Endocarpon pusillum]